MKNLAISLCFFTIFMFFVFSCHAATISDDSQACIECHQMVTPGIVADWKKSRHSKITPAEGMKKEKLAHRVSSEKIPAGLSKTVVGCAECHMANSDSHKDSFEHNGFNIHPVVSPEDCAICHSVEANQYSKNTMANAYANLKGNPVYHSLMDSVNAVQDFDGVHAVYADKVDDETESDSCLFCHGTIVEVKGMKSRETLMGEMDFPVLSGWPNQGVGRINPDGSKGTCTSCHTRHSFSIEMARKPATCAECHKGPDVPAYKVYMVSKHGNIYTSLSKDWNFNSVPWVAGKDFSAPTCATCHASLVTNEEGEVLVERSHQMNDRSGWRIFGLIYAHAHPKSGDTTVIKNKAGLPLPTELTGEPVADMLISKEEQQARIKKMQNLCLSCHSQTWIDGVYTRFERTIETTNAMTLAATKILLKAWEEGAAKGLAQNDSIFNETIEKMWVEQWLFFANSTRFASAMAGADYGVFADGRWYMSKNLQQMADWLDFKRAAMDNKK